jgi:hypothetical protein
MGVKYKYLRDLPPKAANFIKEYRELCKKYNLMVGADDGAEVGLEKYHEELALLEFRTHRLINNKFNGDKHYNEIS